MIFFKKMIPSPFRKKISPYKAGIHCYNQLNFSEAVIHFEKAIEKGTRPHSLEIILAKFYCQRAYTNLGLTHFVRNNNRKALRQFIKAIRFDPDDAKLNYLIGICLNNIGKYEKALASFAKTIENDPFDIPTKLKVSVVLYNLGKWEAVVTILRKSLEENNQYADIHFQMGLALMGQGKMTLAAKSFMEAVAINPDYVEAKIKLGMAQMYMGQHDQALKTLNGIVEQYPEYADVYYYIGLIKEKCGKTEEGIKYLEKALEISPQFKNALVKSIIFYCRLRDMDAAEKSLEKAMRFYPNDKRLAALKRFLTLFVGHKREEADPENLLSAIYEDSVLWELHNEFNQHLDIMPNFSDLVKIFNNTRWIKKDSTTADFLLPLINDQIKKNPFFPDLYNSLGIQLMAGKRLNEAEEAYLKALELNPDYSEARINLFKMLYRNGKIRKALVHGKILAQNQIQFPDVYYLLTKVFIELEEYDEALACAGQVARKAPGLKKIQLLLARIYNGQGKLMDSLQAVNTYLEGDIDAESRSEAKMLIERLRQKIGWTPA